MTRDWSDKAWLREIKSDPDRVVFWTLVVVYSIATAWGIV